MMSLPLTTKKPGSAEALEDYFYATNHLLEYAIRLIEEDGKAQRDTIAANAYREAACVQLRLLGEFLSDNKTRDERRKVNPRWPEDNQCLPDYPIVPVDGAEFKPLLRDEKGENRWLKEDLKDLRESLNKTVAHLTLNRGAGYSISDRELAKGIYAIWPATQTFQSHLRPDLISQFARHIAAQNNAWARFQAAYPHVSDDVSDSGGTVDGVIKC